MKGSLQLNKAIFPSRFPNRLQRISQMRISLTAPAIARPYLIRLAIMQPFLIQPQIQTQEEIIPSPGKPGSGHPQDTPQSIPDGSKPFFGQVSAVSGSKITLSSMNNSTVTVIISSSTEFSGGIKSDIKAGTRIAGYGTTDSGGSVEAVKVMINPTIPSGGKPN